MTFDELEKLIDNVANNAEVVELSEEIHNIISGTDSRTKLLAFLPIMSKIIYEIIEKDDTQANSVENLCGIVVNLIQKIIQDKHKSLA